jgi:16S rRNA (guanine527-N7)-methyltransferase
MEKGAAGLKIILDENGCFVDPLQCELLGRYCSLLIEWNRKINLISRRSEGEIWEEQILHSISFLTRIRLQDFASVIDVGTGGGLPGIPLKILMPGLSMTLVDSTRKKIDAVQLIIRSLGIDGIEAIWSRAEDLNRNKKERRYFDYVICRAVGPLIDIWNYGYPLLLSPLSIKNNVQMETNSHISEKLFVGPGAVIALKGGDISEEVREIERRKGIAITAINITLNTKEILNNNEKKIVIMRNRK